MRIRILTMIKILKQPSLSPFVSVDFLSSLLPTLSLSPLSTHCSMQTSTSFACFGGHTSSGRYWVNLAVDMSLICKMLTMFSWEVSVQLLKCLDPFDNFCSGQVAPISPLVSSPKKKLKYYGPATSSNDPQSVCMVTSTTLVRIAMRICMEIPSLCDAHRQKRQMGGHCRPHFQGSHDPKSAHQGGSVTQTLHMASLGKFDR